MSTFSAGGSPGSLRARAYKVIFEHDTRAGKAFDEVLLVAILVSVVIVMVESVQGFRLQYGQALLAAEWFFTLLFTVEYGIRLWCVDRPSRYALSFFGIVDLLAVAPTYVSLFLPGGQALIVIRILRMVRVFRILKLVQFVGEARSLMRALRAARYKITVFLLAVVSIVVVVGAFMYLIEGADAGFTSIPRGMYWAIVTLTTVGYGDIAPQTPFGQALAALVMIMGYGIIAVPTGIVTVELGRQARRESAALRPSCPACGSDETDPDARFCRYCGEALTGR